MTRGNRNVLVIGEGENGKNVKNSSSAQLYHNAAHAENPRPRSTVYAVCWYWFKLRLLWKRWNDKLLSSTPLRGYFIKRIQIGRCVVTKLASKLLSKRFFLFTRYRNRAARLVFRQCIYTYTTYKPVRFSPKLISLSSRWNTNKKILLKKGKVIILYELVFMENNENRLKVKTVYSTVKIITDRWTTQ